MNRMFRFTLILVLLTIIGSAVFVTYKVFFAAERKAVPMLKNTPVFEAVAALERMGIQARIDQEESALPQGVVVNQWPEPGVKVNINSPVILKVSRGTAQKPLPELRGISAAQASSKLEELGFTVGDIVKINDSHAAGVVIAESPSAPASIPQSQKVNLLVSLGPSVANGMIVVPDLREKDEETAKSIAEASHLRVRSQYIHNTMSAEGMVIDMSPSPGQKVSRGTTVTIKVATWSSKYVPRSSKSGARVVVVAPQAEKENSGKSSPRVMSKQKKTTEEKAPVEKTPAEQSTRKEITKPAPAAKTPEPEKTRAANKASVSRPVVASKNSTEPQSSAGARTKRANIRYQVPPVSGLALRIEMVDKVGHRELMNRKANAGEYVSLSANYAGEAVVTIYLGGDFVWQDRYK